MAGQPSATTRSWRAERAREWRNGLPELTDGTVVLRELRVRDAPALLGHLNKSKILRYIEPCPSTVEDFRRFIRWTHAERRGGRHACYGIIPPGETSPVGTVQVWPIERDFSTGEWGFVLSDAYWGTGLFVRSARLFIESVFTTLGVHRLEARAASTNLRGNGVLRKLGATREGVLRDAFLNNGVRRDFVMWSILASEWPPAPKRRKKAR